MTRPPLRRMLGSFTIGCVGVGAAIGSGIFATPGEAAKHLSSPWLILAAWIAAGLLTLLQSLVTAELATRFPRAGGEYQYLKAAYGPFAAFFFGWSFTIFIVGGGTGTIAAAFGEFTAELTRSSARTAPMWGCLAVAAVTAVNCVGLKTGAVIQNVLTLLRCALLMAMAAAVIIGVGRWTPAVFEESQTAVAGGGIRPWMMALLPIFWSYTGATDPAKLSEEMRDMRRDMPRALVGATLLLTAIYVLYNYALLCAMSPAEMAGRRSVPAAVLERTGATWAADLVLATSAVVCLGAMSSMLPATIRVAFAMARDGLTFRTLGSMNDGQSPVAALLVAGAIGCAFVLNRGFEAILMIYFLASTILFGMTYLSLVVFRRRERSATAATPHASVYRAPLGVPMAIGLAAVEATIAVYIVRLDWERGGHDSLGTLGLLLALGLLYVVWRRFARRDRMRGVRSPSGRA